MTITLYGIPNCDTIKKAKKWLEANNLEYSFHDYRKMGINKDMLTSFTDHLDWDKLLNKRGTTWRGLDDEAKNNVNSTTAIDIMLEYPAIIKRPVLTLDKDGSGDKYLLGFSEQSYSEFFN